MTIGESIKIERKKAGLTQKELGQKIGVTHQTIAQWENGWRNPKIETVEKIADALEIGLFDLMGHSFDVAPVVHDEWISLADRYPQEGDLVLIWLWDERMAEVSWLQDGSWGGRFNFHFMSAVSHWMPLPEPPKEDAK